MGEAEDWRRTRGGGRRRTGRRHTWQLGIPGILGIPGNVPGTPGNVPGTPGNIPSIHGLFCILGKAATRSEWMRTRTGREEEDERRTR